MDVTSSLDAPCSAEELFAAVEDLADYPDWLSIVTRVEPAEAVAGDPGPAWVVELRGRLGPLARSKRLRMVRSVVDPPRLLRFERRETDGRHHSAWVLEAEVTGVGDAPGAAPDPGLEGSDGPPGPAGDDATSRLEMRLHYGGSFGGSLLERMLGQEIDQSRPRLLARVADAR